MPTYTWCVLKLETEVDLIQQVFAGRGEGDPSGREGLRGARRGRQRDLNREECLGHSSPAPGGHPKLQDGEGLAPNGATHQYAKPKGLFEQLAGAVGSRHQELTAALGCRGQRPASGLAVLPGAKAETHSFLSAWNLCSFCICVFIRF